MFLRAEGLRRVLSRDWKYDWNVARLLYISLALAGLGSYLPIAEERRVGAAYGGAMFWPLNTSFASSMPTFE